MNSLLGEARFYFAQCVFNTSCHYSAVSRINRTRHKRQNVALGICISTIIILLMTVLCWECNWQSILKTLAVASTASAAASLSFEFYNREDLTEFMIYHKQAAEDYKTLRDNLMDVIRRIYSGRSESEIESLLKDYLHDYSMIGKYSLTTTYEDYQSAQKSLGLTGSNESFTWANDEIDRFLPLELRICNYDKES
ncbi:MAG: hypothetical protein PHX50_11845 [Massilibacteroides sp.]|nr:hypothetical protein [Massilibacteroides sp.]MDD3063500.1 hypothetical protein [Massilibacteroides sp.]MDD4660887.1 hypothetical protein [Massilibacteroides sp.]